jgi:hypothetical protein
MISQGEGRRPGECIFPFLAPPLSVYYHHLRAKRRGEKYRLWSENRASRLLSAFIISFSPTKWPQQVTKNKEKDVAWEEMGKNIVVSLLLSQIRST